MLIARFSLAHEGLDEQLEAVTAQIEQRPQDAELYLNRGRLHRLHYDFDAALADLERARGLDATIVQIDYERAQAFSDAGWPRSAIVVINQYLLFVPENGQAWLTKARAHAAIEEYEPALEAYREAMVLIESPKPDDFLAYARCVMSSDPEHLADALAILDEGVQRLGPLIALRVEKVDLAEQAGEHGLALGYLDLILEQVNRPESWLVRKGSILESMARWPEAAAEYRRSLEAIAALPERLQSSGAMQVLRSEAVAGEMRCREQMMQQEAD